MDEASARRRQAIAAVLALPRSVVLSHLATHALLLFGCLRGGIPYVMLQGLLALELLLVSAVAIPLYPERGLRKHAFDLLKMSAGLAFVLFFLAMSYAVVATREGGEAFSPARAALGAAGMGAFFWALAYLLLHLAISYWQARRSPDPRGWWARENLSVGGATFVAMFLMVFVSFFVALPLAGALDWLGLATNPDALLSTLMVALRFLLVLVVGTMSSAEMDAMARNPYVD